MISLVIPLMRHVLVYFKVVRERLGVSPQVISLITCAEPSYCIVVPFFFSQIVSERLAEYQSWVELFPQVSPAAPLTCIAWSCFCTQVVSARLAEYQDEYGTLETSLAVSLAPATQAEALAAAGKGGSGKVRRWSAKLHAVCQLWLPSAAARSSCPSSAEASSSAIPMQHQRSCFCLLQLLLQALV
jgi:hypothetical protein